MAEDLNKDINNSIEDNKKNIEDKDSLLSQFKDSLSYLAAEVKDQYRTAFDKALQSLDKWLYSKEKKVQEDVVQDLNTLRSRVSSKKGESGGGVSDKQIVGFGPLYRPDSVNEGIAGASASISSMIEYADKDENPAARAIGGLMKLILSTES